MELTAGEFKTSFKSANSSKNSIAETLSKMIQIMKKMERKLSVLKLAILKEDPPKMKSLILKLTRKDVEAFIS